MPRFNKLFEDVIAKLQPGGDITRGQIADINQATKKATASGMQAMVSGGLRGTTIAPTVRQAAKDIGTRQKMNVKGEAIKNLINVMTQYAGMSEASRQAKLERMSALERTKLLGTQALQRLAVSRLGPIGSGSAFPDTGGQISGSMGADMIGSRTPTGGSQSGGESGWDQYFNTPPTIYGVGEIGKPPAESQIEWKPLEDSSFYGSAGQDPNWWKNMDWSTATHEQKIAEGKRLYSARGGGRSSEGLRDDLAMRYYNQGHSTFGRDYW
jgi:hypothetical protein